MEIVNLQQWQTAVALCNRLPYARRVSGLTPPPSWFPLLADSGAALLESARDGRYTYYIPRPRPLAMPWESACENGQGEKGHPVGVLPWLRKWQAQHRAPRLSGLPPFCGGLISALAYDVAREIEHLPVQAHEDLGMPPAYFALVDELLAFDTVAGTVDVIVVTACDALTTADELAASFLTARKRAQELLDEYERACAQAQSASDSVSLEPPLPPEANTLGGCAGRRYSLDRESYMAAVCRAKAYIAAGDTYQVNLSLRETRPLPVHPAAVYDALRRINPSPYMAYLPVGEWTLVCDSPELLVKSLDGRVEARPIAGTRPRGDSGDVDAALGGELLAHPKERAEHLMLVDLIRNDLGRVCRYGSVAVSDFMVLEGYSHVQHIVSHVVGELAQEHDTVDLIASSFPGGTITGAPKVRTMEIIEELEPVRRGFYTGAIGWFGYNGDFELNIVIRTLLAGRGQAHVQAGAGIVADSEPEREFEESLNKARALWAALEEAIQHADLSR